MGFALNVSLKELGMALVAFGAGILMSNGFNLSDPSVLAQCGLCFLAGFGILYLAEKWGIEAVRKALGK